MQINNVNLKFRNLNYGNNPQSIVLHHAEASSCSIEDIHNWHLENGWAGCGYHYFVRKNGEIYKGRPDNTMGAHVAGFNKNSLGICAEGSYAVETMPEVQRRAIIELCKELCSKYGITKIYGHREVGESNCPGANYPLEEIRNSILSKEPIKEEEFELNNIVIFNNYVDKRAAEYLAEYLNCPVISGSTPFDFSKAKKVYGVGGGKFTQYAKVIGANMDRWGVIKEVLRFCKKL